MFETARRHMPENDIVMCFVINNFGFWYSRYTVPIIWGLDTACLVFKMDSSPWGYSFINQVDSIPIFWNVKP